MINEIFKQERELLYRLIAFCCKINRSNEILIICRLYSKPNDILLSVDSVRHNSEQVNI